MKVEPRNTETLHTIVALGVVMLALIPMQINGHWFVDYGSRNAINSQFFECGKARRLRVSSYETPPPPNALR